MTNKELKKEICLKLKEKGFKQRTDYTISIKDCGYATTSIKVKVVNPIVNLKDIEDVIMKYRDVERDKRTYEILQGCNTFVDVVYKEGIFDEVAREFTATALGVMKSNDETTRIFDGLYLINWEHEGNLELKQQTQNYYGARHVKDLNDLRIMIYKFAKFGSIAL